MEEKYALIIDTVSIQQYIFSSNRLKENIGASYIVEKKLFDFESIDEIKKENYEIGYIGGGNSMLFFRTRDLRSTFKKVYNRYVLSHFPGIRIAYGEIDNFEFNESKFKESRNKLIQNLILQKSSNHLECVPFKMGIVDDCPSSNEGIEEIIDGKEVSKQTALKRIAGDDSDAKINEVFKSKIGKYKFTNELSKLGQPVEKGYIAIVHADGNGIGKEFMSCKTLDDLRKLSSQVEGISTGIMNEMIDYIVELLPTLENDDRFNIKENCLPFRQIVAGGDDITFVCEGKLGIHFAYKLLHLMKYPNNGQKPVSACAGIAIVHSKFPFYKAYQLAEELCSLAKKESREKMNDNDCRLAFLVSSGNLAGDLDAILENNFMGSNRNLFGGSYSLGLENSFSEFVNGIRYFQNNELFPKNKAMQLREALKSNSSTQNYFLTELTARKLKLPYPYSDENGNNNLFNSENKTTLFDMLEMIDFYPEFLK
ncbi:MAG: hypothetical protein IPG55_06820 [Saprospiraceae bacterium]|nr:hypothetical protein [Candidatus Defluviibacterium haderslevense]MBK7245694.1 hypothetical protein [Candidatus Defluviibacterium haderslevense]